MGYTDVVPFACGACKAEAMEIKIAVDVEPDSDSDEARAQVLRCSACGRGALGIYEESRRGRLDSESWRHWGWIVDDDVITTATERLQAEPRPTAEQWRAIARGGQSFNIS